MNLNTITATLLAINIADQRFPNKNIKIVGPGSFTLDHVPRYLKHKVSIFEGNVENYESKDDVLVMVRVLEHIPVNKYINVPIVAITPDMEDTLDRIEMDLEDEGVSYKIQRSMFEIYNQGDNIWDIHKWWTSGYTMKFRLDNGEIIDNVYLDGYRHLVTVSHGLLSSNGSYEDKKYFAYLNSNDNDTILVSSFQELLENLESERGQSQIKIWPGFEYMDIGEILFSLWNLHERMLELNVDFVTLNFINFDHLLDNIHVNYNIVHRNHQYKTFITPELVRSLIHTEDYFDIVHISNTNDSNFSVILQNK